MQAQTHFRITEEKAKALLFKYYGIEGNLTRLVSYQDINFKVRTTGGALYVLKIAGTYESQPTLEPLVFLKILMDMIATCVY